MARGRIQNETYLSPGVEPSVTAGYKKQRDLLLDLWGSSDAATIEYSVGSAGPLVISLSHALSRGDIRASSLDPFSPPSVDWRAFENPLDMELMVDAFRAGRRLMQTPAMTELGAIETTTGNLTTDGQIVDYLRKTMSPSFSHVCCTSPMMPKDMGGVVDEELRVFGVLGLRVIDAGVVPVVPAAHLQATIYAVAEKVRWATVLCGAGSVLIPPFSRRRI